MSTWPDGEAIVLGKPIKEWARSDEGMVDYSKCEFKRNVSNNDEYVIYDLGEYEFDPEVKETTYCNGVDLARVAGAVLYDKPYKGMNDYVAFNGDDYVRIFMHSFRDITTEDFVMYFCHILDGDIYISETNHHVFVKGRGYTQEEWEAAVDKLYSKSTRK